MRGSQPTYGTPDAENPEVTEEQFTNAQSFADLHPELAAKEMARRARGPQKTPTKRMVSLRLDGDVLERWRASGKGWQGRINDTLAQHAPRRRAKASPAARKSARS
jgi:uncharacterized protein (DUF4415 family)